MNIYWWCKGLKLPSLECRTDIHKIIHYSIIKDHKPEINRTFGRPRLECKDDIKMYLERMG
jgi:hypothetical protein